MSFASKARSATGNGIGLIGLIIWLLAGFVSLAITLYVLFSTFGLWLILIGLFFFPVTYAASFFIVWFVTGEFPLLLLIIWLLSFIGMAIMFAGMKVTETRQAPLHKPLYRRRNE